MNMLHHSRQIKRVSYFYYIKARQYYKEMDAFILPRNQKFEINLHKNGEGEFNYYTIDNFEQNIKSKKINNEI